MFDAQVEFGGVLFKARIGFDYEPADLNVGIEEHIGIEELQLLGYYTLNSKDKIIGYTEFLKPIEADVGKLSRDEEDYLLKEVWKHLEADVA